eukprot:scaffold21487_cov105-Isochrysis_galbana.AAC.2
MVVAVELDGDQHVENDVADRCDRGEQIVRAAGAAEDSLLWVPGAPQLCHPLRRHAAALGAAPKIDRTGLVDDAVSGGADVAAAARRARGSAVHAAGGAASTTQTRAARCCRRRPLGQARTPGAAGARRQSASSRLSCAGGGGRHACVGLHLCGRRARTARCQWHAPARGRSRLPAGQRARRAAGSRAARRVTRRARLAGRRRHLGGRRPLRCPVPLAHQRPRRNAGPDARAGSRGRRTATALSGSSVWGGWATGATSASARSAGRQSSPGGAAGELAGGGRGGRRAAFGRSRLVRRPPPSPRRGRAHPRLLFEDLARGRGLACGAGGVSLGGGLGILLRRVRAGALGAPPAAAIGCVPPRRRSSQAAGTGAERQTKKMGPPRPRSVATFSLPLPQTGIPDWIPLPRPFPQTVVPLSLTVS